MSNIVSANVAVKASLDELERAAIAAHASIERLENEAARLGSEKLRLAMKAGDALIEIAQRKLVNHGQWSALYLRTCGSVRMAQIYVTLAENRDLVEANAKRVSHLSINAALRLIRKAKGTSQPAKPKPGAVAAFTTAWKRLSPAVRTEALAGIGFDAIWPVVPQGFRDRIGDRLRGLTVSHLKQENPNTRMKRIKERVIYNAMAVRH